MGFVFSMIAYFLAFINLPSDSNIQETDKSAYISNYTYTKLSKIQGQKLSIRTWVKVVIRSYLILFKNCVFILLALDNVVLRLDFNRKEIDK